MKDDTGKRFLFNSADIKIVTQQDLSAGTSTACIVKNPPGFSFLFLLSSQAHLRADNYNFQFRISKSQYLFHYSPHETEAELGTEDQKSLKYLQIQISYRYISNLINTGSDKESRNILENLTKNDYSFLQKETLPYITAEMRMILKEITGSSKKGIMQKLFIEAKIIKLLLLMIEQFNEKKTHHQSQVPVLIKKYIDENYHKKIRVEEIGKTIGLNQNIIRKEFRAYYQMTISNYIFELRMLKAKKLIIDKEIMIKEIAIECGYEYVQNFTRAFKKKFGVSPEKLRSE